MRTGKVTRDTKETEIAVERRPRRHRAAPRSRPASASSTTCSSCLARHSRIDITVQGQGRPAHRPPPHHRGCRHRARPGGEAGARRHARHRPLRRRAPADGRGADPRRDRHVGPAVLVFKVEFPRDKIGEFDTELVREWFQAFAVNAGVTLHVETLYGDNTHHIAETCFKGLARALRAAVAHRSARPRANALDQGQPRLNRSVSDDRSSCSSPRTGSANAPDAG